jgi:hypothetical protein
LAHEHRTCINRLPYNWKGETAKGIASVIQQTHGEFQHIIMCLTTGGDSEKMQTGGVQVISLNKPAGNSIRFIFELAKQLRALAPDVVHTRNWGGMDGIIAARLAGIRGVVHSEYLVFCSFFCFWLICCS